MKIETILRLAVSENHEAGQTLGLSLSAAKDIAGCCFIGAKNEDEFVAFILSYAETFTDAIQYQINELEFEIEDLDLEDDPYGKSAQIKNDIKILQLMKNWKYDRSKIVTMAREAWRESEKTN